MTGVSSGERVLGRTGLSVSAVCLGTSSFGMPQLYGHSVDPAQAERTVVAAVESGILFVDMSNGYGDGESERIVGAALRRLGPRAAASVLATKVDPNPVTGDFSGARALESFDESLDRLGVDRLPLLHLHDPERIGFEASMAPDGPVAALVRLRDHGRVDHLGVAGGPIDLLLRFIETGVFDVVLTHNRFSLLDRSAEPLIAAATELGLGVINAAPYGGGMLAKGPRTRRQYAYGRAAGSMASAAEAMERICSGYGVPLAAAALQFSVRDPRIHATVVGMARPDRVADTLRYLRHPIPAELWAELERVVPPAADWLG